MDAAQRCQQEEQCEGSVVLVTTAVVDPGTVVVHLHYTSKKNTFMKHRAETPVQPIGIQYAQESWVNSDKADPSLRLSEATQRLL